MFARLPNISSFFKQPGSKASTAQTPHDSARSVNTVATVDIQRTARIGQPSLYKSKSDKRKKRWFDAKLSPRSLKLHEQGFFLEGHEPPVGPNAQVNKIVLPEISVWAKLNMTEDQSMWFTAQVCPSKEMEMAAGLKATRPLSTFLCALSEPKPLPCRLICLHRTAPSKFHISKPDSIEVQKLVGLEITEEAQMSSLQVHCEKVGAWVWHFRNEWERNQMARFIAKMYHETVGHPLKIGGITRQAIKEDGFHPRYFERAFLRKDQANVIRERKRAERRAAREEPDLSDDEEEAARRAKQEQMSRAKSLSYLKSQQKAAGEVEEYVPSVGRDAEAKLGMHVRCSKVAAIEHPHVYNESKGGTGVVTMMRVGPLGVEACEVEWYSSGRRMHVPLKADTNVAKGYNLEIVDNKGYRVRRTEAPAGDEVVGMDVYPYIGMRVRLRRQALEEMPSLMADSKGMPGTITWISLKDDDGDGVIGDSCKVLWETGKEGVYYTGFEGKFFLRHSPDAISRAPSVEPPPPAALPLPHLSPRDVPKLNLPMTLPGNAPLPHHATSGSALGKLDRHPPRPTQGDGDHSRQGDLHSALSHAFSQPGGQHRSPPRADEDGPPARDSQVSGGDPRAREGELPPRRRPRKGSPKSRNPDGRDSPPPVQESEVRRAFARRSTPGCGGSPDAPSRGAPDADLLRPPSRQVSGGSERLLTRQAVVEVPRSLSRQGSDDHDRVGEGVAGDQVREPSRRGHLRDRITRRSKEIAQMARESSSQASLDVTAPSSNSSETAPIVGKSRHEPPSG